MSTTAQEAEANGIQAPVKPQETIDTPMDSPEKAGKGKGKAAQATEEQMPVDESEEDEDEDEDEGEGEIEEPDEDNMEEIDMDNIVNTRTRGKNIDYAEAAKNLGEDDEDDEEDEDFIGDDDKMEE